MGKGWKISLRRGIALLFLLPVPVWAQVKEPAPLAQIIEDFVATIDEDFDYTELQFWLAHYYDHPLDINRAQAPALQQLYILNPLQIRSLINHRMQFGELLSIYELQAVAFFDPVTIERLRPFVMVGGESMNASGKALFSNGEHEIMAKITSTLEEEKGYLENNPRYKFQGSPYSIQTRYTYRYGSRLSYGVIGEKDAGEQFFLKTRQQGMIFIQRTFITRVLKC